MAGRIGHSSGDPEESGCLGWQKANYCHQHNDVRWMPGACLLRARRPRCQPDRDLSCAVFRSIHCWAGSLGGTMGWVGGASLVFHGLFLCRSVIAMVLGDTGLRTPKFVLHLSRNLTTLKSCSHGLNPVAQEHAKTCPMTRRGCQASSDSNCQA